MTYTVLTRPQAFSALHCSEKKVLTQEFATCVSGIKTEVYKTFKGKEEKCRHRQKKIVRKGESI